MKFYFPDPTPSREKFLGAIFFGHDGVFPGLMKFFFPRPFETDGARGPNVLASPLAPLAHTVPCLLALTKEDS